MPDSRKNYSHFICNISGGSKNFSVKIGFSASSGQFCERYYAGATEFLPI